MPNEKHFQMRQQQKVDSTARWNQAGEKGFVPLKGEFIIYQDGSESKVKIGDGITNINDLSFYGETEIDADDSLQIDETLSIPGAAADAKAVGEALNNLQDDLVQVDGSLSIPGAAADAKAVGDVLNNLIDASLSKSGAAADAKVVGDKFSMLPNFFSGTEDPRNLNIPNSKDGDIYIMYEE